jgi:RNA polymerase sigma-70 factor (ECF subfamily)
MSDHQTLTDDDLEWLREARDGDLAAFSRLVLRHQGAVRAFLHVRLSRKHEAEDLAQETFVTAWRRLKDFDPARPFAPWLRGIAENHLRNHLRKFRAEPIGGDEALQMILDRELDSHGAGENESVLATALGECIEQTGGPARELLMARYAEGRSMAELCASSGKKHSAMTMKLHRLRLALAACVEAKLAESH